jgi:hypothetical protein
MPILSARDARPGHRDLQSRASAFKSAAIRSQMAALGALFRLWIVGLRSYLQERRDGRAFAFP